jgi:hypothetical protein
VASERLLGDGYDLGEDVIIAALHQRRLIDLERLNPLMGK